MVVLYLFFCFFVFFFFFQAEDGIRDLTVTGVQTCAINALARHAGAEVVIVDVGVAADLDHPGLLSRKVARGTANMASGPAMIREQTLAAISVGMDVLKSLVERGSALGATGDMGIGK